MQAPPSTSSPLFRRVGPYILAEELAQGGMGRVHLAVRVGITGFRRVVAIKRARPDLSSAEYKQMFASEIDFLAHVLHPNVVAALDVIEEGGDTLLVMEYVHGESLADVLFSLQQTGSIVPMRIAAAVVCDVLHGLQATHEARNAKLEKLDLIHRDVAPDNILIGDEGIARILDFGIATSTSRPGTTKVGYLKGKIAYIAPERLNGEPVDRRVDVYGAGVVLWEALTGRKLFDGDETAVLTQVLAGGIAPPSSLTPGIPPELDAIVARALARNPEDRFATALEMGLALRDFCADAWQVADWLRIVAGESLERKAMLVRRLMLASVSEGSAMRRLAPAGRVGGWTMAAITAVFALAGAFSAWQLGRESSATTSMPRSRTEPPVAAPLAAAAPQAPADVSSEPKAQAPDPEAQAPELAPQPRPTRMRKSAPGPAERQELIDDGF